MKLKIILTTIVIVGFYYQGNSQSTKTWDLRACIDYALENNIQVQQSKLNNAQNQVSLKSAKYARYPNLNVTSNFNLSTGRSINPFTNVIENNDIQSQRYNLNSSVTLFNFSAINNRIKKGQVDLEISEYDLENVKNVTTLNIITFFTNVLLNEEQVKNAEFSLESTKLRLNQVEKQKSVGLIAEQDVLQVKQQLAVDELNLVRAQNSYQFAKLTLQQAMQLPIVDDFKILNPVLSEPEVNGVISSKETIFNQALAIQPDIKSAEASIKSAALDVKISEANLYPTISLSAGLGTSYSSVAPDVIARDGADNVVIGERPIGSVEGTNQLVVAPIIAPSEVDELTYFRQLDFNQNSFVGVNLNIPIFNGLQARNGVQIAKINRQRAELNAQNTKNQLRQNIEQAFQDAIAASKSYQSSKNQVEALQESFKNVEQRRKLGAATEIEYNQIKNDLNSALSDQTRNKYDYIFKLKILDFYQGKPLSF